MEKFTQSPVFTQSYRIYLEDTDAGGIVYHANHLKLFERCRRDWLRKLGMTSYFYHQVSAEASKPSADNLHFVVSDCSVKYLQPILLDMLVNVTVENLQLRPASLILTQHIYDEQQVCLATANMTLACVRSTNDSKIMIRPARLPSDFTQLFAPPNS